MNLRMQLAQLLKTLAIYLRRFWHTWLLGKPAAYPTPFKPWLHPVSRRVTPSGAGHWRRKPDWVRAAVFDLAVALPGAGYRTIASCFNLQQLATQGHQATNGLRLGMNELAPISVSKTFAAKLLIGQRAALIQACLRANARRQARREPIQTTWGMDLAGLPLTDGGSIPIFGVIDHGSRAVVTLEPVATYNSLVLLGKLLISMGTLGKPQSVRCDNDAVFKTLVFRLVLKLIGVRQQFTDLGSPWQNGRMERFWRTVKSELQTKAVRSRQNGLAVQTRMKFASVQAMQCLLQAFKLSYNGYRPHQSLRGATPATVWNGQVQGARLRLKVRVAAPAARSRKARAPPA